MSAIAEILLIPDNSFSLDAAKASAQQVARALSTIGIQVRGQISLCTGKAELQKAVAAALGRSNIVLTLGGLGLESGYLTKTVIADGLRLPLETDQDCLSQIRQYCARAGDMFTLEDMEPAKIPKGAKTFPGQFGKLPGIAVSSAKQHIILLPEIPQEISPMLAKYVIPYLGGAAETTVTRTVRTYGAGEPAVRAGLGELLDEANPAVTVHTENGEVLIRVCARAETHAQAASLCTPTLRAVVERMGDAAYGLDVDSLQSALIAKLRKKDLDIAVAEAGTVGMFTRILSETEGGADILRYSVAVESDEMKTEKLSIPKRLMKKHGSVSEQVAVAMAAGAMEKALTPVGVAITAVTPEDSCKKFPLGLVYIAVCSPKCVFVKKLVVGKRGDVSPDTVLDAAVSRALNMVRLFVDYLPGRYPAAIDLDEALAGKTITGSMQDQVDESGGGENGAKRGGLLGNFIIRKADEPRDKVRKLIFIVAVLVFLGSMGYVGLYYYEGVHNEKQNAGLQQMFELAELPEGLDMEEAIGNLPPGYLEQFAALYAVNQDVVGYISIAGTPVKYPVVQAGDNDYYLRRDFYQKTNQHGIPYLDYRVDVENPPDNMVIYGHNMRTNINPNDDQMFATLVNYKNLEYYRENPIVDFTTVYEAGRYKIFSVFITNAYTNQGPVFEYHNFISAESEADFASFVEQVTIRSLVNTGVDVLPGDQLLTLSTCSYEFKDARTVVVARKVRPGEDDSVDVDATIKNPYPLMPDIWYKTFGGTKPAENQYASVLNVQAAGNSPAASPKPAASSTTSTFDVPSSQPSSSASTSTPAVSSTPSSTPPASSSSVPPASSSSTPPASSSSTPPASSSQADPPVPTPESSSSTASQDDKADEDDGVISFYEEDESSSQASSSSQPSSSSSSSSEEPGLFDNFDPGYNAQRLSSVSTEAASYTAEDLSVYAGGRYVTGSALDIVSRIVQSEIGTSFHEEAVKAQAVAAHSFVSYYNEDGTSPTVVLASSANQKIRDMVAEVIDERVYYGGKVAFTPYHAISAGATTSSKDVWGGSYAYLVSVDSSVDASVKNYAVATTLTRKQVEKLLSEKLGIQASGDPAGWFEVVSYGQGGYNGAMRACGYAKSPKTGAVITGRVLREGVFSLRSACFEVDYSENADTFTFTTYGYGHGVGLSQHGANLYAQQGLSYEEILEHYYPGTSIH